MGTAFAKGRNKNKQSSVGNGSSMSKNKNKHSNVSISVNNNGGDNNGYNAIGNNMKGIKPTYTGSSSISQDDIKQQHPYLNTLNPNNIEVNTGLTNRNLIPSNSKSHSSLNTPKPQRELRNNTTDKHLNTLAMHKLLCFGWIRQNCLPSSEDDNNEDKKEISINILEICFEFIYIEKMMFCFIASENEKISTLQAIDINNIYKSQFQLSRDLNIGYDTNGICIYSEKNIKLPSLIKNKYSLNTIKNRYHCIFKCGSEKSRDSRCLIIPQSQFAYNANKSNYNASRNIDDNGMLII